MDPNTFIVGGTIRNLRRSTCKDDMVQVTFELANYRGLNRRTGKYITNEFTVRGYITQKQSSVLNIGKKIRVTGKMQQYTRDGQSHDIVYMDFFEFMSTETSRLEKKEETTETFESEVEF